MPCTVTKAEEEYYEKEDNRNLYGVSDLIDRITERVACELAGIIHKAGLNNQLSSVATKWIAVHAAKDEAILKEVVKPLRQIFTTAQVARICNVAPRIVAKWFDSGKLRGYRIPGSQDRRIPREHLVRFMTEHGLPMDRLDSEHLD